MKLQQQRSPQLRETRFTIKFLNHKATTLVECLSVVVSLGILLGIFHTIFVSNWSALEERIALATLQEEADQAFERMSREFRQARQINIAATGDFQSASILDADNNIIASYRIHSDGTLQASQDGENFTILSNHLDYENSGFAKHGKALAVHLRLSDQMWYRTVKVNVATEIFPRN